MIIVFSITTNNHNKQFIKMQHNVSSTHSGQNEETLAKLYNNVLTHSRRLRIPGWKKIDLMIDEVAELREYITHNIDNDLDVQWIKWERLRDYATTFPLSPFCFRYDEDGNKQMHYVYTPVVVTRDMLPVDKDEWTPLLTKLLQFEFIRKAMANLRVICLQSLVDEPC